MRFIENARKENENNFVESHFINSYKMKSENKNGKS